MTNGVGDLESVIPQSTCSQHTVAKFTVLTQQGLRDPSNRTGDQCLGFSNSA